MERDRTLCTGSLSIIEASDGHIALGGRVFVSDPGVAYAEVRFAHSFPVFTWYGECLMPGTVVASHLSLADKPVSREHRLNENANARRSGKAPASSDFIVGHLAAVEAVRPSGFALPPSEGEAAHVRAVVALYKQAAGVTAIVGEHQTGRHQYTVSMEVEYLRGDSGFLVRQRGLGRADTPEDLDRAGWSYVPFAKADERLLATRDWKRSRMAGTTMDGRRCCGWLESSEVYWVMGGLSGQVFFPGLGWVKHGAEPTAAVDRLLAGLEGDDAQDAAARAMVGGLADLLSAAAPAPTA